MRRQRSRTDFTSPTGHTVVLNTTQHHPFWSETRQDWTDAAQLQPGEQLLTADGDTATVSQIRNQAGSQTMRDLTVDTTHTYYVIAGDTPVLVHNTNGPALCGIHGGDSGSPGGPGLVEGPAPKSAHDMLNNVNGRPDGIGTKDNCPVTSTVSGTLTRRRACPHARHQAAAGPFVVPKGSSRQEVGPELATTRLIIMVRSSMSERRHERPTWR
jgi:hypothetical protein